MGSTFYCDMCGKDIPTQENVQEVKIKDVAVLGACYTCASALHQALKKKKGLIMEARKKPVQPEQPAQPAPEVPPPQEPETVAPPPPPADLGVDNAAPK